MKGNILKARPGTSNISISEKYNYAVAEYNEFLKEIGVEEEIGLLEPIVIAKQD